MKKLISVIFLSGLLWACTSSEEEKNTEAVSEKMAIIFDTDANNELDDQHAMAYLFSNLDMFDVKAITVNATRNGGDVQGHYDEAERIMNLFNISEGIPLLKGANGSYTEIKDDLENPEFDGYDAVDFIISEAQKQRTEKLVVLAVGKLTNLALALQKDPQIVDKIRLVWLGANYPNPGEYNLNNDIPSMNYVLSTAVDFEMVTVRYGKPSGTAAVKMTLDQVNDIMPGLGPHIETPITGRHGGEFDNFGDYAVDLFKHIELHGEVPSRALFDMAAVAIVKDSSWAKSSLIPCPIMVDEKWMEQPDNERKITIWEYFNEAEIIGDFITGLKKFEE